MPHIVYSKRGPPPSHVSSGWIRLGGCELESEANRNASESGADGDRQGRGCGE